MKIQNTKDKATARPWKFHVNQTINSPKLNCRWAAIISDNSGLFPIARLEYNYGKGKNKANAELIVKAVNQHNALVAVAEAATKLEAAISDFISDTAGTVASLSEPCGNLNRANANLATIRKEAK